MIQIIRVINNIYPPIHHFNINHNNNRTIITTTTTISTVIKINLERIGTHRFQIECKCLANIDQYSM